MLLRRRDITIKMLEKAEDRELREYFGYEFNMVHTLWEIFESKEIIDDEVGISSSIYIDIHENL